MRRTDRAAALTSTTLTAHQGHVTSCLSAVMSYSEMTGSGTSQFVNEKVAPYLAKHERANTGRSFLDCSSEKRVAEKSFEAMKRLSRDNRARISCMQKEFDDVSELLKQMALLKQLHEGFSGSASTSG